MAAKHEDMDKLTKDLENLEVEESKTVTKTVEDFRALLSKNNLGPHTGIAGMFEKCTEEKIGIKLREKLKEPSNEDLGNLLQYLIYKYLEEHKQFKAEDGYKKFDFYDESFGEAVMKMMQPVEATTKHSEANLPPNTWVGGERNFFEFRWTSGNYPNPSPGYALQLLLYQWLAGQRFEEERGAKMYLIRFVESTGELQLFQFNPPEKMQYSQANAGVDSYKVIVRLFLQQYYPQLLEDSD